MSIQRNFKDAEIYLIRFQQCLTRSMTLIKMYFVNTITALGNDVASKTSANKELSETAANALLYTKFSTAAEPLKALLFELEKRAIADPDEYASLLSECYSTWFSVRNMLLAAPLAEEIRRMDPYNSELIRFVRVCAPLVPSS